MIDPPQTLESIRDFDSYLNAFGATLGRKANDALTPLHVPGRDPLPDLSRYGLKPYPAQAHIVAAATKLLAKKPSGAIIGECGVGKTMMAQLAIHEHACMSTKKGGKNGRYRAIVVCPNHLIDMWCREIARFIPGAIVRQFGDAGEEDDEDEETNRPKQAWKDFLRLMDKNSARLAPGGNAREARNGARWDKPEGPEWYIVGKNQIKFYSNRRGLGENTPGFNGNGQENKPVRTVPGAKIVEEDDSGAYMETKHPFLVPACPRCGSQIIDRNDPVSWVMLKKKKAKLYTCTARYLEEVIEVELDHRRKGPQVNGIDKVYLDSESGIDATGGRRSNSKPGAVIKMAGKQWVVRECGEPLWQYKGEPYRWSMAHIIQRKMRKFFTYFICDEVHEQKDENSIQARAFGKIWAATDKRLALTGTFLNGYSTSIYSLLMKMCPEALRERGFDWGDSLAFAEEYGRVDTIVTSTVPLESTQVKHSGRAIVSSRSSSSRKVAPGVMPTLFSHLVMPISMFLTLEEMADYLPNLIEVLDEGCVRLDSDIQNEYDRIAGEFDAVISNLGKGGATKVLGAMLQTLLTYPDHPYGFDPIFEGEHAIGYWRQPVSDHPELMTPANWCGVVTPRSFDIENRVLPKERSLINIVKKHVPMGHKVWVYVQSTRKYNVMPRLQRLLSEAGFRCGVLNADDVEPTKREAWVRANGHRFDVIISHPKLVSTGLDLFMKAECDPGLTEARYKFNFNVLDFFQCGYNLFDTRQASRRSWRLGQELDCFVYYQYYRDTMQHRAMELASRKLEAALQLEGSFSEAGLAAMSSDSSAQMLLCRGLSDKIDPNDIQRRWPKINARTRKSEHVATTLEIVINPRWQIVKKQVMDLALTYADSGDDEWDFA